MTDSQAASERSDGNAGDHTPEHPPKDEFRYNLDWYLWNARTNSKAHYKAAQAAESMNRRLGVPTVALGAIVSTSIFASLEAEVEPFWRIATALLSISAAVLAAIQTFLNFSARASEHRAAGAQYGDVRRRFEAVLMQFHTMSGDERVRYAIEKSEELLDRLADLAASSPDVKPRFWEAAKRENEEADEEERYQLGISRSNISTVNADGENNSSDQSATTNPT